MAKRTGNLEEQVVRVPLGGSLNQGVDPLLIEPGQVATSENVVYDKHGRVSKDPGTTEIPYKFEHGASLNWKFANVNVISEHNESLIVGGRVLDANGNDHPDAHTKLCQYEELHTMFDPNRESLNATRDNVWSPVSQKNIPFSRGNSYLSPLGMTVTEKYYWFACVDPIPGYLRVVAIERTTGAQHTVDFVLPNIKKVRVHEVGSKVVVLAAGGGWVTAATFDKTDPSIVVPFANLTALNAAAGTDLWWESCVSSTTGYLIVAKMEPATGRVSMQSYNSALALQVTLVIAEVVAVADGYTAIFQSALTTPYLVVVYRNVNNLRMAYVQPSLSAVAIGPITVTAIPAADSIITIAGAADNQVYFSTGVATDRGVRLIVNYQAQVTSPLGTGPAAMYSVETYFVDSLGVPSGGNPKYNYTLLSTAVSVRGRAHFVIGNRESGAALVTTGRYATEIIPKAWFGPEEVSVDYRHMTQMYYAQDLDPNLDKLYTAYVRNDYQNEYYCTGKEFKLSDHCRFVGLDKSSLAGGGFLCTFDGNPAECGYWHGPEIVNITTPAGGGLANFTYSWCATYEWIDGNGDIHLSQPSPVFQASASPGDKGYIWVRPISLGSEFKNTNVKIVIYRNTVTFPTIFFRVAEAYNDFYGFGTGINDLAADVTAEAQPQLYTTGGVLSNATPPPARIVYRHGGRVWIINDDDKKEIWASKPKVDGVAPEFLPELTIRVPEDAIGLGSQGDNLIVLCEKRIYTIVGDGPNALGIGSWAEPRPITLDVGCNNEKSVIQTDVGIMFQNARGIYLLGGEVSPALISQQVEDTLLNRQIAGAVTEYGRQAVRLFLSGTGGKGLIFDMTHSRWSVFSYGSLENVDAVGRYGTSIVYFSNYDNKLKKTGTRYKLVLDKMTMKVVTPWINVGSNTAFKRVWWLGILGEWKAPHDLVVKISQDYVSTYDQTITFSCPTSVSPYLVRIKPARQKCMAIRLEIYDDDGWLSCTGTESTNIIIRNSHGLIAGETVNFRSLVGGAGISTATTYYVINPTTNNFQISLTSGGAAVNFTTDITSGEFSKRGNSCTLSALEIHAAVKTAAPRWAGKDG